MPGDKLPTSVRRSLVDCLSGTIPAEEIDFKRVLRARFAPSDLRWQPAMCVARATRRILVHALASLDLPGYLKKAINELRAFPNTDVLVLARDVAPEIGSGPSRLVVRAPSVAARIAQDAVSAGCGLAFEHQSHVHLVFPSRYRVPNRCGSGRETGHVPQWVCEALSEGASFSPYLLSELKRFTTRYARATSRRSITYDRECELLHEFAKRVARGDNRLFFPVDELHVLKQYEASGATKARDHFFHTFNTLFLGYLILGKLAGGGARLADIDALVSDSGETARLRPWESLWFLTCMFHDPGYLGERPWAAFRFAYGVEQASSAEDPEIPAEFAQEIRNIWETEYAGARSDLRELYRLTINRWLPPSVANVNSDAFDQSLRKAYFDGRSSSHSLLSGLRLISLCRSHKVPGAGTLDRDKALLACEIAALSMMFHDHHCRETLKSAGIPPIPFERLPYAAVLMYVDSLQDDRRNIRLCQFEREGVLKSLEVSTDPNVVRAVVRLPQLPGGVGGWPERIAGYESVIEWISAASQLKFEIDYHSEARIPRP